MKPNDAVWLVVSLIDLPFACITTYEDKRLGTGYAVVLKGTKAQVNSWCHDPDDTDPPFFYHRNEQAAWDCFDLHHPHVREAISLLDSR